MTDIRTRDAKPNLRETDSDVGHGNADPANDLNPTLLTTLLDAALSIERTAVEGVLDTARQADVSKTDIADFYIPDVARTLGEMWVSDHIGFAEVTIGSARLQAMLRDLGPEWAADTSAPADAASILLLTPRDASHTLGAVVIAGQLRRRGYSVRIAFAADRQTVADLMDRIAFDAVFMSAARSESLEKLRRMIEFIRTLTHKDIPIVLGGTVLKASADVAPITGADIATSHLDEAIQFCGLLQTQVNSANSAVGTSKMCSQHGPARSQ